jgi:hypothetical protein
MLTLGRAVKLLRKQYGPLAQLPTANPFELVLLENVAYLCANAMFRSARRVRWRMGVLTRCIPVQ